MLHTQGKETGKKIKKQFKKIKNTFTREKKELHLLK
jgi:hypothetical protein